VCARVCVCLSVRVRERAGRNECVCVSACVHTGNGSLNSLVVLKRDDGLAKFLLSEIVSILTIVLSKEHNTHYESCAYRLNLRKRKGNNNNNNNKHIPNIALGDQSTHSQPTYPSS
jgi:hypothetical protein